MSLHDYEFQSEFAKKYAADARQKAFEKGYKQGLKQGLLLAIEGLTDVLGISLSAEQRETIENGDIARREAIYCALRFSRQWPTD